MNKQASITTSHAESNLDCPTRFTIADILTLLSLVVTIVNRPPSIT